MKVDLLQIKEIYDLAKTCSTGCPDELAQRLHISTRSLSDLIKYMRDQLEIPIHYDRINGSYYCAEDGYLSFKFQKNKDIVKKMMKVIESSLTMAAILNLFTLQEFLF